MQAPKNAREQLPSVAGVASRLPWTPQYAGKAVGWVAVANTDLKPGHLVYQERAYLLVPSASTASQTCHACLTALPPSQRAKQPPAPAADGEAADADAAPAFNALLPRYCSRACAAPRVRRDIALHALRQRLHDISRETRVDPELLHLVALLDIQRATGEPPVTDAAELLAAADEQAEQDGTAFSEAVSAPLLVPTAADVACLQASWDKRAAPWRKAVGPALRATHKELVALAGSGKVEGYTTAGSVLQLQASAAMLATHLVGCEPAAEAGLALFPGITMLSHSCNPNCIWVAAGNTLYVRTTIDVPAGTALTISLAPLYETRSIRRQALALERGITCSCERCTTPMESSVDRFLEGVWCHDCRRDVLVRAADQEAAAKLYADQAQEHAKHEPHAAHGRGGRGKKDAAKKAAATVVQDQQPPAADADAPAEVDAAASTTTAEGGCAHGCTHDHDHGHSHEAEGPAQDTWWQCCGCRAVVPGSNDKGAGPEQLTHRANLLWQRGLMYHNMKAYQSAEPLLRFLSTGLGGRLYPLHARVIDSLTPLLNITLQRGDSVGVFNLALELWESEHAIVDRPTLMQLNYLAALTNAAQHKATHANSSVVRKQFDRKFKLAQTELNFLRKVILGADPAN